MSESIEILLALNATGITEARAQLDALNKDIDSMQATVKKGGLAEGLFTPTAAAQKLDTAKIDQQKALLNVVSAREAVEQKGNTLLAAQARETAAKQIAAETQVEAIAAQNAAQRAAAEQNLLSLLEKEKVTRLEMARLEYGIDKTPAKKQAVDDATRALVLSKSNLANSQAEQAAAVKTSQLLVGKSKLAQGMVADRVAETTAAQAALTIEQQRLITAQRLEIAAQQLVNDLKAQVAAQPKEWTSALFKERVGQFNSRALPPNATRPTKGSREQYFPADPAGRTYTPSNANLLYVDDWIAAGKQAEAQLKKTGKTGSTAMKQTGAATNIASASMRNLAIGARSVGSVLSGTSLQGGLYYMSQIGRTMKGWPLIFGLGALGVAAIVAGFASLVREGAKIEGVSTAFENLTKSAGLAGRALSQELRDASRGTVTIAESMTSANRALMAGGAKLTVELPRLMEIARVSAIATGKDVSYTFDSLVKGIVRGSPRLIDNADIYLKLGDANSIYAKELGKTVTELSAQEKQIATLNEVLRQGEISAMQMGLASKASAEDIKSIGVALKDLIAMEGKYLAQTGVTKALSDMAGGIETDIRYKAAGKDLDELIRKYGILFGFEERFASQQPEMFDMTGEIIAAKLEKGKTLGFYWSEADKGQAELKYALAIEAIIEKYQKLLEAEYEAQNIGDVGWVKRREKLDKLKASTDGVITELEEFEAAWAAASEGAKSPLELRAESLFSSLTDLTALIRDIKMPEISAVVLPQDIANLRAWADTLKNLGIPEDKLLQITVAIDRLETSRPALSEVGTMLDRIAAKRAQPIVGADLESGLTDAIGKLDDLAQKADEVGAYDLADKLRGIVDDKLITDVREFYDELVKMDAAGLQAWFDERTRGTEKLAQQEIDRRTQLIEFQEKLADIASRPGPSLKGATTNLPEIGTQLFSTDLTAIDAYYAKLERLEPENADLIKATRASIAELQNQKDAMLAAALAADDPIAALRELTQQEYGASTGLVELIGNLNNIPGAAVGSANGIRIFGAALDEIIAKMRAPISLSAMVESIESGANAIQASALDLAKYIGPEKALATSRDLVDRYMSDVRALGKRETAYDKDEWDVRRRYIEDYYTGIADSGSSYYDGLKSKSKEATASLKRDAGEVQSAIEAALSKGREVTPADMLATKAGTYKDAPLENARRLDAIAERGFAELKAHPDWAGILGIPPEIMGGTEDQLKAWAARTAEDVDNLLRPDLIDWDAFIANYKQGLQDEATKKLTLDIALGKLKTAGLLEGKTDKEARAEVLKMLGLEEPEVTFDSYFNESTSDDPAAKAWMDYLRTGKVSTVKAVLELTTEGAPPVETLPGTKSTEKTSNSGSYKLSATTGEERAALIDEKTPVISKDIVGKQTTDVMLGAMNQAGKDIAGAMYASFDEAIKAQTPGLKVATYWGLDFAANIGLFENMGTHAGNTVGAAFVTAIETKTGKVRQTLAKAVAGELLPELDRRYVRKGTPD